MTLTDAIRYDRGHALRSPRRNAAGFLLVDGYAASVGCLLYPDASMPDGIRRELRLREDLETSLAGYEGIPLTDDHPAVGMLDPSNARDYQRGTVLGPAHMDGEQVAVSTVITDASLIAAVESGKVQLSPGYRVKLDSTPGVHPIHGRFDARQVQVIPNHLAIVARGRGGPAVRLRTDGADGTDLDVLVERELDNEARNELSDTGKSLSSGEPTGTPNPERADGATAPTAAPSPGDRMPDTDNKTNDLAAQLAKALEKVAQEKVRADAAEKKLAEAEGSINVLNAQATKLNAERGDGVAEAKQWLDKAIARHERHMAGTEDTSEASQQKMMDEMKKAREELGSGSASDDAGPPMKMGKRADAVAKDTQIAELTTRVDNATKELDSTKARLDEAEKLVAGVPAQITAGVKSRLEIERAAGPILAAADGQPARLDDKTDRQVMELVITKRGGTVEADRNDDFVRGAFNAAVKSWQDGEAALAGVRGGTRQPPTGGGSTPASTRADGLSGRDLMVARNRGLVTD